MKKLTHMAGTDPEFFLREKESGKLRSAIEVVEGTKEAPHILTSGGGLHHDNVAVEFSTKPQNTVEDLITHIREIFKDVRKELPDDLELVNTPAANFDADQLDSDEAKMFGCSPDFCAWKVEVNDPPIAEDITMRSCGGHIHVGYIEESKNDFLVYPDGKIRTVRTMDLFHGISSVLLDNSEDAVRRRKLYGKAGCHRPTDYGIEYRVLSNFWLKSPHLLMLMTSLTEDVLAIIRADKDIELIEKVGGDIIQDTINNGHVEKATEIWKDHVGPCLSKDSKHYMDEVSANISKYNFCQEWQMEE